MIRFGLRLAVAGGREAAFRLAVIAAAVALGVGLLLATLAGVNAVDAQIGRTGWMRPAPVADAGARQADPVWWVPRPDYYDGKPIDRIDVAATGTRQPVLPGVPRLPGPGEYYASPALAALITGAPAGQLADRLPGRQAGIIGAEALPSPDSLIVLAGSTPDEASKVGGAVLIAGFSTEPATIPVAALDLILAVVAGGLLFPVLIFIATATRLSAARREQRFAAMRLIGATPRQVSVIAAVESTAAAVAGTAVGFGLFYALRGRLAEFPFTGLRFYPDDLSLGWPVVLLVALGVPAAAAIAARFALRRVRISPLGVSRRVTPAPPRAYRLIPLLAGFAELAYFIGRRPATSTGQTAAFLPGFLIITVGLVIAGPWLTMIGARVLARRASRPPALIAARRLADNPQAAFRAVSGVILALFVTSVAIGVITTIVANRGTSGNALTASTLAERLFQSHAPVPDGLVDELRAIPGVRNVTVVRTQPSDDPDRLSSLIACADLARAPEYGRCPDGAAVAEIWQDLFGYYTDRPSAGAATVWPAARVTIEQFAGLPVDGVVVGTDGSLAALETARTKLVRAYPEEPFTPVTPDDLNGDFRTQLNGYRQLANVIILFSLPIAGCSLAVSVAAGITDRKRPFSLLRLTGVPLRMLRRVVALESAVPLLAVAVIAIGAGLGAAQLFLKAQLDYTLRPPGTGYYLIVVAGLLVSLGIIAATLPLLERITGPETARSE